MAAKTLSDIFTEKATTLADLERIVSSATEGQRSFRPASGLWNMTDNLEHLVIVETGIIRLIARLLEKAESRQPASGTLSNLVTIPQNIERLGPVKTAKEFEPSGGMDPSKSLSRLRELQDQFFSFQNRLAQVDISLVSFPHSQLGPLTVGQWAAFLVLHEQRHLEQMRRIAAHPGFGITSH